MHLLQCTALLEGVNFKKLQTPILVLQTQKLLFQTPKTKFHFHFKKLGFLLQKSNFFKHQNENKHILIFWSFKHHFKLFMKFTHRLGFFFSTKFPFFVNIFSTSWLNSFFPPCLSQETKVDNFWDIYIEESCMTEMKKWNNIFLLQKPIV